LYKKLYETKEVMDLMGEDPLIEESRKECIDTMAKLKSALEYIDEARDYNLHTFYLDKQ
jgi:hypothetical protein